MSSDGADLPSLTSDVLLTWYGYPLPEDAAARAGADIARISEAFRQLPPPPFDLQAHHFPALLEALADD